MAICIKCMKHIDIVEWSKPDFIHVCDPEDVAKQYLKDILAPIAIFLLGVAAGVFFTIALS